jgi:hypothetical protein
MTPLFCQVNEDGFGSRFNRYAWGMTSDDEYLYVGTLNVTLELPSSFSPEDLLLYTIYPEGDALKISDGCELWRYDGERWECMMEGGFGNRNNTGIRNLQFFEEELYAGTINFRNGAALWKSPDQGKTWEPVALKGIGNPENESIRGIHPWNDELYIGTTNILEGAELYRYDGERMVLVADRGIDNPFNVGIGRIREFHGRLVLGTWNLWGWELYAYDGIGFEKLIGAGTNIPGGFGIFGSWAAMSIEVFKNRLYVGTANFFLGFSLHRTIDGYNWKQIGKLGFGDIRSKYNWDLVEYRGRLFLGTFDIGHTTPFAEGCQLYRSFDGKKWERIMGRNAPIPAGFGDGLNYGIRNMEVFKGDLYAGTSQCFFCLQPRTGCEIWKFPIRNDDSSSMD